MSIDNKRSKLYQEFRQFTKLSDEEKVAFKEQIRNEASLRTEEDKREYQQAIIANVLEIKEKILEIKERINLNQKRKFMESYIHWAV